MRDVDGDRAVGPDLRVVADAAEQAIGDARRATRTARDFVGRFRLDADAEDPRGATYDLADVLFGVVVEPMDDAEAGAQRRRQQAGARRGADERERLEPASSPTARPAPGRS